MYGHQEATVLDAPWSCHWPKLLLWLFTEGVIIALGDLHLSHGPLYAAYAAASSAAVGACAQSRHLKGQTVYESSGPQL